METATLTFILTAAAPVATLLAVFTYRWFALCDMDCMRANLAIEREANRTAWNIV